MFLSVSFSYPGKLYPIPVLPLGEFLSDYLHTCQISVILVKKVLSEVGTPQPYYFMYHS